jgi:hypothetical protein
VSELFSEWVVEAAERVHHVRRACDVQASDVLRGAFSGPWTGVVIRDEQRVPQIVAALSACLSC